MTSSSPAPAQPSELTARISKVSGVVFVAFLAIGFASCAWLLLSGNVEMLPPKLTRQAALEGDVTHKIAKQLSKAAVPELAADLERGASWLVLHDTGPRVRSGCPGWLFLTNEMRINRFAQANAETKSWVVRDIQQRLAKRGITLLVAVVPDKSRIASAQLCDLRRPAQLQDRVVTWVDGLNKAGVAAMDLAPTLQPLGADAYLRTDTHWSEIGSAAAAKAVARQVQAMGISATPQKNFEVKVQDPARRPGDLVRLAGLEWLPVAWQPTPETVATSRISEKAAEAQSGGDNLDDLFGDDNLPNVALIGTSFSRNSNFLGFLQQALGAPIGNFAKDGGEFSGGANGYFNNPAFMQTPPKLIVWEIPERDLQTPYGEVIDWAK
ncbi:cell division protein FtsQ [Pseudomonas sp. RIT-PI-q]|uniref:alginate O-acetyltransferase AlgX-related protein n=1 Tax=Pseudomonas sp. RIT-PI-q TaxID=1690247 RepID=UPI0006CD7ADC|nr:cell division protein FtsQ [Pseudomonas sp. RIT-PI-q]KPG98990.1 cell division protein FtsQ [Pseudomonas sp. RIT-PI-q]